jgi:hypothetical protein
MGFFFFFTRGVPSVTVKQTKKKNCYQGTARVGIMPTWAVLPPEKHYYKQMTSDSNPKFLISCYSLYERFRHERWRLLYYSTYVNLIQASYYIGLGKYHKD